MQIKHITFRYQTLIFKSGEVDNANVSIYLNYG